MSSSKGLEWLLDGQPVLQLVSVGAVSGQTGCLLRARSSFLKCADCLRCWVNVMEKNDAALRRTFSKDILEANITKWPGKMTSTLAFNSVLF